MSLKRIVIAAALVCLVASPASAQWYDDEEAPAGEGEILNPFMLKGFALAPGFQVVNWMPPGDDLFAYTMLARGGYAFDSYPIYIGIELPLSLAYSYQSGVDMEFALGNVGLNFKARVDPDNPAVEIFTGWSLDLYIPTFMGGGVYSRNTRPNQAMRGMAAWATLYHSMQPGLHIEQEAINLVGTFDFVVPGHLFFFQFELSAGIFIPVTNWSQRNVTGGLGWGGTLGVNLARPIALLLEFKGYTPLGSKDLTGIAAPTVFGISPGLRMRFGPFQPALWVTFALDENFRRAWPDVIIGLDLGLWF
jgi:hypothetical protein